MEPIKKIYDEFLTVNTPVELITEDYCKSSVETNVSSLAFVPDEFLTQELILRAIMIDPNAIQYVSWSKLTPELCMAAVSRDWKLLKRVPIELRTEELCLEACKQNPMAILHVKKQTQNLSDYVIGKNPKMFKYIEDKYLTSEICKKAMSDCV